jgi:hypothetical protein
MKNIKQMGIWMDHSNALLMELTGETIVAHNIVLESIHKENEQNQILHGKPFYNKEQRLSYYKKIGDFIRNFQEVVLFGPTDAKNELLNLLRTDHLFEKIKIEVIDADKMSENQMYAFVKDYFRN